MRTVVLLMIMVISFCCQAKEGKFPAIYETTTTLNVRVSPTTRSGKLMTLKPYSRIQVEFMTDNGWGATLCAGQRGYVSAKYLRYVGDVSANASSGKSSSSSSGSKSKGIGFWELIFDIALLVIVWLVIRHFAIIILNFGSSMVYRLYWIVCIPFYVSNWLQRFLAKPWRILYKVNSGNNTRNAELRYIYKYVSIPLYFILTPLRFVNAFYYNMIVHCSFEMYNYLVEVFLPANEKEGADDFFRLVLFVPVRVLKYVVWHGGLTVLESAIWTVVDTFIPALTLFHGTDEAASTTITHAGRDGNCCRLTGIWNVGKGNFAGNGIYFAPARSTALHYAVDSLIVCRVSLGKVIDLGLAPYYVYKACGRADAFDATRWGLNNGYVTGEWWRKDTGWWEYCMYDWKNRYNYSWRIRPLYVLNLGRKQMQRIPGGMCHWLFRGLVIEDIMTSIEEALD